MAGALETEGAAGSPPDRFKTFGLGYVYHDGKRFETEYAGSTDFESGKRYVVALIDYSHEPGAGPLDGWGTFSQRVIVPLEGDKSASQPERGPIAVELAGRTLPEVTALLSETKPYPSALAHPDRSATARDQLVTERGER